MINKKLFKLNRSWFLSLLLLWSCEQEISEPSTIPNVTEKKQIPEFKATLIRSCGKGTSGERGARMDQLDKELTSYLVYSLNVAELSSYVASNEESTFKLTFSDTLEWDLVIEPSNLLAPNYKSTIITDSGEESGDPIDAIFYKGQTTTGSNVNLMLEGGIISGFVQDDINEIYIESSSEMGLDPLENEIIIYNTVDIIDDGEGEIACPVEDIENTVINEIDRQTNASCDGQIVVEIATFANYDRYKNHFSSSVSKTNKRILEIINNVGNNYDDFGIKLQVVEQQVATCSSCMPFSDSDGMGSETLNNFASWAGFGFDLQHDVGLLFMGKNSFQNINGIAYVNEICGGEPYGIIRHNKGLIFERKSKVRQTTAHEIGHIFGASHVSCKCIMKSGTLIARNKWASSTKELINSTKNGACLCETITNGWLLYSQGKGDAKNINSSASTATHLRVGDFNGDGKDDIIRRLNHSTQGLGWYIKYSGSGAWIKAFQSHRDIRDVLIGDFDGDGEDDIFADFADGNGWHVSYSAMTEWQKISTSTSTLPHLKLGDFNGDQVTDVIRLLDNSNGNGEGWRIAYGNKGRNMQDSWVKINSSQRSMKDALIGDFDGDGKDDVFTRGSSHWEVALAANGFQSWVKMKESMYDVDRLKIGDFNGDGQADLLTYRGPTSSSGIGWAVVYSGSGPWTNINRAI